MRRSFALASRSLSASLRRPATTSLIRTFASSPLRFTAPATLRLDRAHRPDGTRSSNTRKLEEEEEEVVEESAEDAPAKTYASIESSLHPKLYRAITAKPFGYTSMSAVQASVLSLLPDLASPPSSTPPPADLLVRARTGTGKTLAFLIPALEGRLKALDDVPPSKLREVASTTVGALIISPTRELAQQIANEARMLSHHIPAMRNGVHLFVGGESRLNQLRQFKRGTPDVIVATPGRLVDLLSDRDVREAIATTRLLVLDEADTLLDMGFAPALEEITGHLAPPAERQTFLFSATVSPSIRAIAKRTLNPSYISIDTVGNAAPSTHAHIPQYITVVPAPTASSPSPQLSHLVSLIKADQAEATQSKIVIFLPTTRQTQLFALLLRPLLPSTKLFEIHSKKDQSARSRASASFRAARGAAVLVTSDVSARGVDYPGVTRVIQIGAPPSTEGYIHRVGRTGRAGKAGRGDLIVSEWERGWVKSHLGSINLVPLEPSTDETIDNQIANVLLSLDPQSIQETFGSLLGYYVPRARDFGGQPSRIIEGLQAWTIGLGLSEGDAYVSPTLLKKLGVKSNNGGRQDRFGGRGWSSGGRPSFDSRDRDGGDRRPAFGSRDRSQPHRSFDDRNDRPSFSRGGDDRPSFSRSRDDKPAFSRRRNDNDNDDASVKPARKSKVVFGHSAATSLWEADAWEGEKGSSSKRPSNSW